MEASPSSNQVLAEPTHDASPRTVRTNWLLFAWSQISGATKVILLVSIALSLFQITTTIVILVIGSRQSLACERPFQLYLIIFVVRVGLSLPLSIYQHLFMPRRRRGPSTRIRINNNNAAVTIPAETHASTEQSTSTTTNHHTTEDLTDQENRPQPATIVSGWTERKPNDSLPKTNKYLTIPKLEDAVCTICLSEYENDELVCKLWCDHHYHYSCVTEWLGLNSKCPLCKRDFRGKDFVNQDSDDEEEQV
ncbi:hypothetical protein HPULCUR_000932 [Helicostylum pulchrum]|uniref:RING-type E3 ubiquitin transferase n=1 Tax=Helicostylum pulchrum TaxID=562976 RepID=A0ABP9XL89_9FUNG